MKWTADSEKYRKACLRAANDLTNFKQDPDYFSHVGNDTRGADVVEAFDKVVYLPYVSKNDKLGNPSLHNGKSAGTLRYMKVYQDIKYTKPESIVEIGGGYGGQCLVIKEFMPDIDYGIIDIEEACELQKAYLNANDVDGVLSISKPCIVTADLCIADYSLTEFDEELIRYYVTLVGAEQWYITGSQNIELVCSILQDFDYTTHVSPEHPITSRHYNYLIRAFR